MIRRILCMIGVHKWSKVNSCTVWCDYCLKMKHIIAERNGK